MTKSGTWRVAGLVAAVASLVVPAVTLDASASSGFKTAGGLGPGCDRSRPAVAHFAGGVRLSPQPARRPIPCTTSVGQTAESATVGITRSGAVMYAPRIDNVAMPPQNVVQGPEFVVRSRNRGATWTALNSGGPTTGGLVPPWMDVDPQTSRVWFLTTLSTLCGARISWSDDDGNHWHTNPKVGCPGQGGERVLEGPAPRGGARPHGYPHVVYYCANGGLDTTPTTLACYRSRDGGRTFGPTGGIPDPPGKAGACGVNHVARPGVAGPDGDLYFSLNLCGNLGIAISRDEGATWHRQLVTRTNIRDVYTSSVGTDSSGNVYIAWLAGKGSSGGGSGLPYLVVSRDHGRAWSKPMMIAAPGVKSALHEAIAATGTGHIAISYLGSNGGVNFSGYITESSNALARRPVFLSAAVNDPVRPLISGSRPQNFGDRLFLITDAFGPDGIPWAAFHCAYESACPDQRLGVVGRLANGPTARKPR